MRIRSRTFLQSTLMLSLMAGLSVPNAAAGNITVNFSGNVTGELPGASYPGNVNADGKQDPILSSSFVYATSGFTSPSAGVYTLTGLSGNSFSLNVSTLNGTSGWSDFYLGNPNVFKITMTKSGTTTTLDLHVATLGGTAEAGPKGSAFMDLVFTSTNYTGGLALPTSGTVFLQDFCTTKAMLTWDPIGPQGVQGFFSDNISGFIVNGQSIPEPSSLVLGLGALATCAAGVLFSRRKAARALGRSEIAPSPRD
jgi:hypothetical protein